MEEENRKTLTDKKTGKRKLNGKERLSGKRQKNKNLIKHYRHVGMQIFKPSISFL